MKKRRFGLPPLQHGSGYTTMRGEAPMDRFEDGTLNLASLKKNPCGFQYRNEQLPKQEPTKKNHPEQADERDNDKNTSDE